MLMFSGAQKLLSSGFVEPGSQLMLSRSSRGLWQPLPLARHRAPAPRGEAPRPRECHGASHGPEPLAHPCGLPPGRAEVLAEVALERRVEVRLAARGIAARRGAEVQDRGLRDGRVTPSEYVRPVRPVGLLGVQEEPLVEPSDLVERLGSVYLAAAAYNAGAGRVERGIGRLPGEAPDSLTDQVFFQLAEQRYLKRETRDYVPKLIAAALIAKQPARYGFTDIEPLAPLRDHARNGATGRQGDAWKRDREHQRQHDRRPPRRTEPAGWGVWGPS